MVSVDSWPPLRQPHEFPAGRPEVGKLEAFGLRALDAIGVRLAQIFLITALLGVPLAASSSRIGQAALACLAIAVCAGGVAYVLQVRRGGMWLTSLVFLTAVTVALLASATPAFSWDRVHDLAAWVVAGMASGVAASRGPVWGLVVFIPAVAIEMVEEQLRGGPASVLVFLGAFTYCVGAAVTHVLARRGFASTERALEAVAAAETAQRVAEERREARRESDRLLHDTILATLSLLAHQGKGIEPGELRAACRRDLGILHLGRQEIAHLTSARPGANSALEPMAAIASLVRAASREAAIRGLNLRAHVATLEQPGLQLDQTVATALSKALVECVANARHARIQHLDLMASVVPDALVLVVVDEGCGFDLAAVSEDRLGLRASVQERLAAVGGSATIWSQPGMGTSVVLRVPRLAARP